MVREDSNSTCSLINNEEVSKFADLLKAKHGVTEHDRNSPSLWSKSSSCLLTRENISLAQSCLSKLDEMTKVNMLISILRLPRCLANEWCSELTALAKDCLRDEQSISGWLPVVAKTIVAYLGQVSRKNVHGGLVSKDTFIKYEQQLMTLSNACESALRVCPPEILPLEYLYSNTLNKLSPIGTGNAEKSLDDLSTLTHPLNKLPFKLRQLPRCFQRLQRFKERAALGKFSFEPDEEKSELGLNALERNTTADSDRSRYAQDTCLGRHGSAVAEKPSDPSFTNCALQASQGDPDTGNLDREQHTVTETSPSSLKDKRLSDQFVEQNED